MPDVIARLRSGAVSTVFLLAAGISLFLMSRTDSVWYSEQRNLYLVTAALMLIASICTLNDWLDVAGQVLVWNAIGWCAGLAFFGLENIGSLPLWPIVLAALALTFWPRWPGSTINAWAIGISLIGGFAACWLAWGEVSFSLPSEWMDRL